MADAVGARITGMEHKVQDIKEAVERISNHRDGSQNVTKVTFEGGGSVITSALVGLVAGVCLGVSVAVAVWVASAFNRQDTMNNWTAQEITAVRSYITTGKLAPMEPRPMADQEKK